MLIQRLLSQPGTAGTRVSIPELWKLQKAILGRALPVPAPAAAAQQQCSSRAAGQQPSPLQEVQAGMGNPKAMMLGEQCSPLVSAPGLSRCPEQRRCSGGRSLLCPLLTLECCCPGWALHIHQDSRVSLLLPQKLVETCSDLQGQAAPAAAERAAMAVQEPDQLSRTGVSSTRGWGPLLPLHTVRQHTTAVYSSS